jgi:hypothetical protein
VRIVELRPGLHRWTAPHPDAEPNPKPGSPADWGPDVGCVAYEAEDALLLVDPLVPDDDWAELDALVERVGRPVTLVVTIPFHRRSREAVAKRYGATEAVPAGVEAISVEGADETIVWLPAPRALIPGDRVLGDDAGGLRLCPQSWLGYLQNGMTRAQLAGELRPLLDLPIELVLVSHGEPVLRDGRAELGRALDAA